MYVRTTTEGRVLLCALTESASAAGFRRLRGHMGKARLVGFVDRDQTDGPTRWHLFAEQGGTRVFLMTLVEKTSKRGNPRLSGRWGPTKVIAFPDRHAAGSRWQVYIERFDPDDPSPDWRPTNLPPDRKNGETAVETAVTSEGIAQ